MKRRTVGFARTARADLERLCATIADASGLDTAVDYVERVTNWCLGFEHGAERGRRRDDIRPGIGIAGFEKRVAVAFRVAETTVVILRVFHGGRNWERELRDS